MDSGEAFSFVVTGLRGSGKTKLWTEIKSNVKSEFFIVEPFTTKLNAPISQIFKEWIDTHISKNQEETILKNQISENKSWGFSHLYSLISLFFKQDHVDNTTTQKEIKFDDYFKANWSDSDLLD